MKDLRFEENKFVKSNMVKISGYQVNEESVKEMLTFMGVEPTTEIIQGAIGYLSKNSMEFTMSNLHSFLQSKSIMSSKVLDLRKEKKN